MFNAFNVSILRDWSRQVDLSSLSPQRCCSMPFSRRSGSLDRGKSYSTCCWVSWEYQQVCLNVCRSLGCVTLWNYLDDYIALPELPGVPRAKKATTTTAYNSLHYSGKCWSFNAMAFSRLKNHGQLNISNFKRNQLAFKNDIGFVSSVSFVNSTT